MCAFAPEVADSITYIYVPRAVRNKYIKKNLIFKYLYFQNVLVSTIFECTYAKIYT